MSSKREIILKAMVVVKSKLTVKTLTVLATMMTVNSATICHLDVKVVDRDCNKHLHLEYRVFK